MNISDEDFNNLVRLTSVIVDGPEQGVINNDQVEVKEYELILLLREYGGKPYGQKVSYLDWKFGATKTLS